MNHFTVMPAYGRDYKNQKEVKADWDAGKDFQDTASRKYLSKRDMEGMRVTVRYGNLRKLVNVQ